MLKTYGAAPYGASIKKLEKQIKEKQQSVDEKIGVKVRPCTPGSHLIGLTTLRNRTQGLRHHIYGMSPPTVNECPKSSLFR